jgi:hypothetical protein
MGDPIIEVDSFDPEIPGIDDGDDAEEAIFEPPIRKLANRTFYLKNRLEVDGVKLVRTVDDTTALAALSGMDNGELAVVPGLGIFRFESGSSATAATGFIVQPGAGSGRWKKIDQGFRTATSVAGLKAFTGMADGDLAILRSSTAVLVFAFSSASSATEEANWIYQPDSGSGRWLNIITGFTSGTGTSRRWGSTAPVPNRLVSDTEQTGTGDTVNALEAGADFGPTLTIAVVTGDIVHLEFSCNRFECGGGSAVVLSLRDTTNGADVGTSDAQFPVSYDGPAYLSARWVSGVTGNVSIRPRLTGVNDANIVGFYEKMALRARVIRP